MPRNPFRFSLNARYSSIAEDAGPLPEGDGGGDGAATFVKSDAN